MASKPKPKQKNKLSDKEQSERFKETARKLDIKESAAFSDLVKKIVPNRRSKTG
jgi:hypothetical protein